MSGELLTRGSLVVSGNAAATAANILAAPSLWRAGIAATCSCTSATSA